MVKHLEAAEKERRRKSTTNSPICCISAFLEVENQNHANVRVVLSARGPTGHGLWRCQGRGLLGLGVFIFSAPHKLALMLLYPGQVSGLQLPQEEAGTFLLF